MNSTIVRKESIERFEIGEHIWTTYDPVTMLSNDEFLTQYEAMNKPEGTIIGKRCVKNGDDSVINYPSLVIKIPS